MEYILIILAGIVMGFCVSMLCMIHKNAPKPQRIIYLAGGMSKFGKEEYDKANTWRVRIQTRLFHLTNVEVVNPNDYYNFFDDIPKNTTEREIMDFDLNYVRKSNVIIVNFNDIYSLGTMAEIAIAFDRRIPIIGIAEDKSKLHPWQIEMCTKFFTNDSDATDYVEKYYCK